MTNNKAEFLDREIMGRRRQRCQKMQSKQDEHYREVLTESKLIETG